MSKRVSVFIDASNLWAVQKVRGQYLDLKQLKEYLKIAHGATTMVLYYYDAYPETGTRDYDTSGKHAFYTYLKKGLGFIVRKSPQTTAYYNRSRRRSAREGQHGR